MPEAVSYPGRQGSWVPVRRENGGKEAAQVGAGALGLEGTCAGCAGQSRQNTRCFRGEEGGEEETLRKRACGAVGTARVVSERGGVLGSQTSPRAEGQSLVVLADSVFPTLPGLSLLCLCLPFLHLPLATEVLDLRRGRGGWRGFLVATKKQLAPRGQPKSH